VFCVTIDPVIENGFYYYFSYKRRSRGDLAAIEKKMTELAKRDLPVHTPRVAAWMRAVAYFQEHCRASTGRVIALFLAAADVSLYAAR